MTTTEARPHDPLEIEEPSSGGSLTASRRWSLYRSMVCSRRLDEREILLKQQNKIFFQVSGAGHEAIQVAAADTLSVGLDWFFLYYRDRALALHLGVSAESMLLAAAAKADDPHSGGRQMPNHWSDRERQIVSSSSPVGTQFLQAVGCAEASSTLRQHLRGARPNAVTLVTTGEGTTSEGEFWESLSTACNLKLPLIYLVEDNGYAISVPVEVNTPGGSISELVRSFPDLLVLSADGCDLDSSHEAFRQAVQHARAGNGPALIHASVIRPFSHSLSDDEAHYRTAAERDADHRRDPIVREREKLLATGVFDEEDFERLEAEITLGLDAAWQSVETKDEPEAQSQWQHVYGSAHDTLPESTVVRPSGNPQTLVDAVNQCLQDEMRRDESIVVFGEDVADASREEALDEVTGKGGVFKVTHGLQREFGSSRVFNSPLAEANIVGRAIGMALRGLRPVVEIQFFDYIWPAYHQIRNELATLRWRSVGTWSCPVVIRVPIGGYLRGGAVYHSQSGEVIMTHVPGLRVVMPSGAEDAVGLLRSAIRGDDPVLFLEHKHLYRQTYNRAPYPGPDYQLPLGSARIVQEGHDVTIVTYGALVERSRRAIQEVASELSVELIDLRSLSPYDWPTIEASVKKTNRVIVAHEDALSWGYGAEISARIAEELFAWLDAPVGRIGASDTFVAYSPQVEDSILPQVADIVAAIRNTASF